MTSTRSRTKSQNPKAGEGSGDSSPSSAMQEETPSLKRKQRSESYSTVTSKSSVASSNGSAFAPPPSSNRADDAGSSRLFQPHRSLGLLTAASPHKNHLTGVISPSAALFTSHKGKFHLEPQGKSSLETFVTLPLGDRFQIMNCSKLVPVMVSRSLPPSAEHHRRGGISSFKQSASSNSNAVGDNTTNYHKSGGLDEEEMHQAISDSSLSITVATHGPKMLGRAVSITLFQRTRPIVSLDAFPFSSGIKSGKRRNCRWGIVDVIQLGKLRVEMQGEKEGKMENALLLAVVCARSDLRGRKSKNTDQGDIDVEVVGKDSDDSEESDSSSDENEESTTESNSSGDETSELSLEGNAKMPSSDCYGRMLLVRALRTTMEIIKTIDLNGIGSNFIPYVGIHPATYVNKILLGGRPTQDSSASSLLLVNVKSGKMIHSFNCLKSKTSNETSQDSDHGNAVLSTVTTLQQSPAVDTIAVGTSDGLVHLINTLHDVKLFTLHHKIKHPKFSNGMNAISSLSFRTDGNATRQGVAPLAVGRDDGSISVWDLTPVEDDNGGPTRRTLLTVMNLVHYGGVSKLEYLPGEPLIISTGLVSNSILMHVFDAPDHSGRILRQRKGHTSPPALIRYLHPGAGGGGILANASDGTDASSCQILSCGGSGDLSLRVFSSARSNLDKEYSQGAGLERKAKKFGKLGPEGRAELLLPEIIGLATSESRSRDWGDLVTIHRNHAMAYVWSTKRGAQSGPVLRQSQWNISAMKERPPRSANASSLAISSCGNFALVGTVGGVIYKYNLQSGLPRGSFPKDAITQTEEEERRRERGLKFAGDVGRTMRMLEKNLMKGGVEAADVDQAERDHATYVALEAKRKSMIDKASHVDAVVGIAIDSLNKTVVTAGADSKLVLWNFVTHMPHKKSPILLPSPATKLCHVRDSDLAAIAMNDFGIAVFDCSSLSIVRYFGGRRLNLKHSPNERISHNGIISDLGFGPDGRKLFSSSLDGSIRVWDVPTGVCVDWMTFSSPPTSLTLSPTGEFLATSHEGRLGISLWCDKSFFRMVHLDGTPTEPFKMNEPCPVAECEDGDSEDVLQTFFDSSSKKGNISSGDGSTNNEGGDGIPPTAKEDGLITLSGLPPAHWKNLFHLELVKERNKPTQALQKPPQAPFFLQWRAGLDSGTSDTTGPVDPALEEVKHESNKVTPDGWDAVWSDGDDENEDAEGTTLVQDATSDEKQSSDTQNKRKKVVHQRSHLAELLHSCSSKESFSAITQYLATMGPSSIDVEISSLCYGPHDLEEGLPLLHLASTWLLEACKSHQSFEAVNAYLHRFLHVHGNIIAGVESGHEASLSEEWDCIDPKSSKLSEFKDTLSQLRKEQQAASDRLQGKMQHTICLLRHLSRMV
ncbi:hypothetical protein HJC23_013914 [Cyclotella cryptica]|uniref:Small-subunit processome Utp21 domain-containing protein n=1 Tax=Cyclotella cryptica TaxID=29204 RepID=A0ABD3QH66_9STRA|eukprot:CCRYP_005514-RA/>CCRYP_005514-RA protein AED:0.03 eAED:0.03 QI:269/1/1/1/1/1/2/281/1384